MKVQLTKTFLKKKVKDKKSATRLCIDVIKYYIKNLTIPDKIFVGEVADREKFEFFCERFRKVPLRERQREHHQELFDHLLEHGIRNDEVLHWYIWEFLGFNIPREHVCKKYNKEYEKADYKHIAPFDYVSDMFFERIRNSIVFANRTGGKTIAAAILNHLDMTFKVGCEVASAGAILEQANKVYRYFREFHKHPVLAPLLLKEPTVRESFYTNDSMLQVVTGSVKGLNSPHPVKARIDEVELMDWDVLQQAFSMSKSSENAKAQDTFLCVTKDTVLHPFDPCLSLNTDDGIFRVSDLVDLYNKPDRNMDALLYVVDKRTNTLTYDRVKRVWKTKRDKVYKIKYRIPLDHGRYIYSDTQKITIDHLILLKEGQWIEVGELKIGDLLAFFSMSIFNYKSDYAEFLGIEYCGIEDVYDIEMRNYHNFIADEGIVLHNSTRKVDTGTFQRLLDDSEKMGMQVYCWCIWEVLEKCTRQCKNDPKYGDCVIWDKCKGIAHHCSGWYKIGDWIDKARKLSRDTLDAEWFNKKPSREALVYGGYYDEELHRKPAGFRPEGSHVMVVSAIDFGSSPGHPFVYQKCWVDYSDIFRALDESEEGKELKYKLKFYLFYEYRSGCATLAEHSEKIKTSPYYVANEVIFADPSAKQERIELDRYNIETFSAVNAIESGIDMVRSHLEPYYDYGDAGVKKSWFYIIDGYLDTEDDLIGTDREFLLYRYSKFTDGKINKKVPIQVNDHGMDCTRYIVQSIYQIIVDLAIPPVEVIEDGGYWHH